MTKNNTIFTFVLSLVLLITGDGMAKSYVLPVSNNAFSGSSINVLSGVKQTVFTHDNVQYLAFYNASANLVIAKRDLATTVWHQAVTEFKGNVNDAHNHISLVVDGAGFVHIAWDHHNSPLKYARSTTPGSLTLAKHNMLSDTGQETLNQEASVTYPQFYRLPNGNLLFAYRDGGSGRGNLVLNRYDVFSKSWHRLHNNLIDGEGVRNAYWDMMVDKNGILHLAWIWRETPDVASNHDIAYAQSRDQGNTWHNIKGNPYQLPITAATSSLVKAIGQNHKLMNPPVVTADSNSNPFIASYWADSPEDKPRYHVMYATKSNYWREIKAPKVKQNFALSGHGTKRPPISRAVLLVDSNQQSNALHLVYRDDFNQGNIVALTLNDIGKPAWETKILLKRNVGAWEPSLDTSQWLEFNQVHMLIQTVEQQDGNDSESAQSEPTDIELLVWKPSGT